MPRPSGVTGADGLPLWDTFEAVYFLFAGLSVGLVLGFLFPSLWRTFRRRFRNTARYALEVVPDDVRSPLQQLEDSPEDEKQGTQHTIDSLFITARTLIQNGNPREAVQVYLEILGSEQVSKQSTNRALFELSQTYALMGLYIRSFETAIELLHRKPKQEQVLTYLLSLVRQANLQEKVDLILKVWKGDPSPKLRLAISHALAAHGEILLEISKFGEARETAGRAARWDLSSGRARILLWKVTSLEVWKKCGTDAASLWTALAADLEVRRRIGFETGVSPAAGSEHLAKLILSLANHPTALQNFPEIEGEFLSVLGKKQLTIEDVKDLEAEVALALLDVASDTGNRFPENTLQIGQLLAPNLGSLIGELLNHTPLALQAIIKATKTHKCQVCHSALLEFAWVCPRCQTPEALQPAFDLRKIKEWEDLYSQNKTY